MKFRLQADITFEADDLDDALVELATHFLLKRASKASRLVETGCIDLRPNSTEDTPDDHS